MNNNCKVKRRPEKTEPSSTFNAVTAETSSIISSSNSPAIPLLQSFDEIVSGIDIPNYLDEHKAVLRFPETLLLLIVQAGRDAIQRGLKPSKACLAWTRNGKAIIVRNSEELFKKLLPLASCQAKFSSLVRKLYRWGFRQGSAPKEYHHPNSNVRKKIFSHSLFQRDNKPMIAGMRSITAEGKRRALAAQNLIDLQDASMSERFAVASQDAAIAAVANNHTETATLAATHTNHPSSLSQERALLAAAVSQSLERLGTANAALQQMQLPNSFEVCSDLPLGVDVSPNHHFQNRCASIVNRVINELGPLPMPLHTPLRYFLSGQPPCIYNGATENFIPLLRPDLVVGQNYDNNNNNRTFALQNLIGDIHGDSPFATMLREAILLRSILRAKTGNSTAMLPSEFHGNSVS